MKITSALIYPSNRGPRPEGGLIKNLTSSNESPARGIGISVSTSEEMVEPVAQTQLPEARRIYSKAELFDIEPQDDEIDHALIDAFGHWDSMSSATSTDDPLDTITIEGTPEFQRQIRALCEEFRDVFSNDLPDTAAKLEPFDLIVNKDKWQTNANRMPPRMQSIQKNDEIQRQIYKLIASGILKKSVAPFYSQIILIEKPNS